MKYKLIRKGRRHGKVYLVYDILDDDGNVIVGGLLLQSSRRKMTKADIRKRLQVRVERFAERRKDDHEIKKENIIPAKPRRAVRWMMREAKRSGLIKKANKTALVEFIKRTKLR